MTPSNRDRRSGCPISYSLDIFGDRWTLLILRDIVLMGKERYRELAAPERIATNILSDRLKRLESAGIVSREPDSDDQRRVIYRATAKGRSLVPLLLEMAAWGATWNSCTDAPAGFAEGFYRDRERHYAKYLGDEGS